ncbi:MAG: metallophosphoesterase family protein [bacterium]|nr:metallophosphoesterase family protein [bacterium]
MMKINRKLQIAGSVFFVAVWLAAPGCGGSSGKYSAQLVAGPFLSTVTQDSATITWQTDKKEKAILEYGSGDSYGKRASGQTEKDVLGEENFYLNTVSIGGLEPVTWTHYRIISLNQPSQDYSFRTAPAPGGDFRFMVYGNSSQKDLMLEGTVPDDSIHQAILSEMKELAPDFVINTGDMVRLGDLPAEWIHFLSILGDFASGISFYPVLGNHDQGGEEMMSGFFGTPPDVYYSFDYGNSHFTVINTYVDFSDDSVQKQWLAKDLTEAKQRAGITRLFAFMHAPAYCSAPNLHSDDQGNPDAQQGEDALEYLAPLFTSQGVKMVFQGHVRIYERTKAISGKSGTASPAGVVYIVTGGGGALLDSTGSLTAQPWTVYKESANHFVEMSLGSNSMTLKARYKDGIAFDTVNY